MTSRNVENASSDLESMQKEISSLGFAVEQENYDLISKEIDSVGNATRVSDASVFTTVEGNRNEETKTNELNSLLQKLRDNTDISSMIAEEVMISREIKTGTDEVSMQAMLQAVQSNLDVLQAQSEIDKLKGQIEILKQNQELEELRAENEALQRAMAEYTNTDGDTDIDTDKNVQPEGKSTTIDEPEPEILTEEQIRINTERSTQIIESPEYKQRQLKTYASYYEYPAYDVESSDSDSDNVSEVKKAIKQ